MLLNQRSNIHLYQQIFMLAQRWLNVGNPTKQNSFLHQQILMLTHRWLNVAKPAK